MKAIVKIVLFMLVLTGCDNPVSNHIKDNKEVVKQEVKQKIPDIRENKVDSPIFHIKVVPYLNDSYCIHFTNDNWETEDALYETFDLTMEEQPVDVIWQQKLFSELSGGCEGAIRFARRFKTYKMCVDNNTKTYKEAERMKQFYLLHPPPERKTAIHNDKPTCNIETNIY